MSAGCPVPGCGAAVRRGHLMCRRCWHHVPRATRAAVNRTWSKYLTALRGGTADELFDIRGAYVDARTAAIASAEASRP